MYNIEDYLNTQINIILLQYYYSQKVIYYLNTHFCEAITQNLKRITCNNQKYSFLSLSSLISVLITISIPS